MSKRKHKKRENYRLNQIINRQKVLIYLMKMVESKSEKQISLLNEIVDIQKDTIDQYETRIKIYEEAMEKLKSIKEE